MYVKSRPACSMLRDDLLLKQTAETFVGCAHRSDVTRAMFPPCLFHTRRNASDRMPRGPRLRPVFHPAIVLDPYPFLNSLRREAPVFYLPDLDHHIVTRLEDIEAITPSSRPGRP